MGITPCLLMLSVGSILFSNANINYKYKYAITSDNYIGAVSDKYNTYYLLKKFILSEVNEVDRKIAFKECFRHCFDIPNCTTFVIDEKKKLCFLTKFDRCKKPKIFLRRLKGFITYEMKDRIDDEFTMQTCFEECLLNNATSCEDCGRKYCSGYRCDNCKKACWEIRPYIKDKTYFWVTLNKTEHTICDKEWQLVMSSGKLDIYGHLFKKHLWLRMEVILSNNETKISYFKGFKASAEKINVGEYIGGSAGNSWKAPFDQKNLTKVEETNCYNFFYESVDCNIKQLHSYEAQKNKSIADSDIKRGFIWDICNMDLNGDVYVKQIFFYVTPQENENITQSELERDNPKLKC